MKLSELMAGGVGSGCTGDGCGRKKSATKEKSDRAKETFIPSTKERRAQAEANQTTLAKVINGREIADNKPFDVLLKTIAIEVKTFLVQKNDKVTMHPSSLEKKMKMAKQLNLKPYTVVFDQRDGKNNIYYKKGLGSFRLNSLTPVNDIKELRSILR